MHCVTALKYTSASHWTPPPMLDYIYYIDQKDPWKSISHFWLNFRELCAKNIRFRWIHAEHVPVCSPVSKARCFLMMDEHSLGPMSVRGGNTAYVMFMLSLPTKKQLVLCKHPSMFCMSFASSRILKHIYYKKDLSIAYQSCYTPLETFLTCSL